LIRFWTDSVLFLESTFRLHPPVVEATRRGPLWQAAVDLAVTLKEELPAVASAGPPTPGRTLPPSRLLVADAAGNPAFRRIAERTRGLSSDCDIVAVPGLPHFAMATEPRSWRRPSTTSCARVNPRQAGLRAATHRAVVPPLVTARAGNGRRARRRSDRRRGSTA
jgi:hypothetical protein